MQQQECMCESCNNRNVGVNHATTGMWVWNRQQECRCETCNNRNVCVNHATTGVKVWAMQQQGCRFETCNNRNICQKHTTIEIEDYGLNHTTAEIGDYGLKHATTGNTTRVWVQNTAWSRQQQKHQLVNILLSLVSFHRLSHKIGLKTSEYFTLSDVLSQNRTEKDWVFHSVWCSLTEQDWKRLSISLCLMFSHRTGLKKTKYFTVWCSPMEQDWKRLNISLCLIFSHRTGLNISLCLMFSHTIKD